MNTDRTEKFVNAIACDLEEVGFRQVSGTTLRRTLATAVSAALPLLEAGNPVSELAEQQGDALPLAEHITDHLCHHEYDIGGRSELLACVVEAIASNARQRFEAWARLSGHSLTRAEDGEYCFIGVRKLWTDWQAALTARQPGAQVPRADLVPGIVRCAKCAFQLARTTLYMGSGTVGAGDSKTEPCPNGCGPLWPVTWETWAREGWAEAERLHMENAATPPAQGIDLGPRPMDTAPCDGTMVRLLVQFTDNATEDTDGAAWTIGANNHDHDGEDVWKFAGWCWTHDHFTEGTGTPVGWLPLIDGQRDAAPGVGNG